MSTQPMRLWLLGMPLDPIPKNGIANPTTAVTTASTPTHLCVRYQSLRQQSVCNSLGASQCGNHMPEDIVSLLLLLLFLLFLLKMRFKLLLLLLLLLRCDCTTVKRQPGAALSSAVLSLTLLKLCF